jgi:hypothetical protein
MVETFGVRGRVLAEDGRPLAGTRVLLGPDFRSAETGADGTFAFDGLERSKSYWMWAREDDFYTPISTVSTEEDVELRMRRGTTFIARVYADGAPLAGATVALARTIRATTDERGIATIRGVPPETFHGHVIADGRATHRLLFSIHDDAGGVVEQTIELERGAEVAGRVVDRSGNPVSDVRVMLTGATSEVSADTIPNADGCWSVSVRKGRYQIGAASRTRQTLELLAVECDGQTPQRDLVLEVGNPRATTPGGRIAGFVVDEQGRLAEGAHIRIADPSQAGRSITMNQWIGQTDPAGRFETHELEHDGELDVFVSWGRLHRDEIRHRSRVGETTLRLVLPSGATLVGRALLDGAPLPYFGVRVTAARSAGRPTGVRSADGRFAVPHVPPGPIRVSLLGPGTQLVTTDEIIVTGNETIDLGDIALARGHRVNGFVRDRSGKPVADARILVGRLSALKTFENTWSRLERWFQGQYEGRTDETGAYVLDGTFVARGSPLPEILWATHPIAGDSIIRELADVDATIDFILEGRGRIEGVVENLRGGHTSVTAVRADEPLYARQTMVSVDRRFEFDVPPGEYVVRLALGQDPPATTVKVVADQTVPATLVMIGARVELTLVVPSGRAQHVKFERTGGGSGGEGVRSLSSMGTEDHICIPHVQPGEYRAMFDDHTWLPVVVGDASQQTIDLRMIPTSSDHNVTSGSLTRPRDDR